MIRLSPQQAELLKSKIQTYLPESQVYLFGSRVDMAKKGGDIDILVLADRTLSFQEKIAVKLAFYQQFGEQKIDIVSFTHSDDASFKQIALLDAVRL
ncbi:MAG: nucleotidyltransferase domain-containing protein [Thiotrichaceae bacterium]